MAGVLFPAVACILLAGVISAPAAAHVFTVGGEERGWRQPTANEETYNHWATRNRFHVGDSLYFKYAKNDSVLVVTQEYYKLCSADKPVLRFDGGETSFRFERSGFFYFISGAPGHCDAGQRMTIRVMVQNDEKGGGGSTAEAPAMSPGNDDGGSFKSGSGSGSGFGLTPGSGAGSGSGSVPAPRGKTSSASSMHASLFGGYHVAGVVLGAAMLILA